MKYLNTLLLALFTSAVIAQPAINFDLHQSIGQEWGEGVAEDFPIGDLPLPLEGENLVWDFTFLGDLDNGYGVTFSEAEMEDFRRVAFQNMEGLPLNVGGTAQDSFPTAIGTVFLGNDTSEYDDISIWGQNDLGIQRLGEIRDYGNPYYHMDDTDSSLLYPTKLTYGETTTVFTADWGLGSNSTHGVTIDSFFTIDTFTYIGFGTLKMYYGDVEDVVLYQHKVKNYYRSYSQATGELIFESDDYRVNYLFQQNGNFIPLIYFNYYTGSDWMPNQSNTNLAVYVPYSPIINNLEKRTLEYFNFSISPNPASDKIAVNYFLEKPMNVQLSLYDSNGREIISNDYGIKRTGTHLEELILPDDIPFGNYFLRIKAGNKIGAEKVVVRN